MDNSTSCPFCALPPERVLLRSDSATAFRDAYPVSPGHTLVIPVRHVASFFDTTPEERASLIQRVQNHLVAGREKQHVHMTAINKIMSDRGWGWR